MKNIQKFNEILNIKNANKIIIKTRYKNYIGKDLVKEITKRIDYLRNNGLEKNHTILFKTTNRLEYFFFLISSAAIGADFISISENYSNEEFNAIQKIIKPSQKLNLTYDLKLSNITEKKFKLNLNNINVLFLTSGSTSTPKLISHKFEKLINNAVNFNQAVNLKKSTVFYHLLPVGYMAGVLNSFLSPIMCGGSIYLSQLFSPKSSLKFWDEIIKYKINTVWLTPSILNLLTRLPVSDHKKKLVKKYLKKIFVGTAPLHLKIRQSFEEKFKIRCLESFGMTECMIVSIQKYKDKSDNKTVGEILKGVNIKIKKNHKNKNQYGEILIKSKFMMKEYFIHKKDQYIKKTSNNWLKTGDIGFIDSKQRLNITGRIKDIFIKGGINLSPKYLENVFLSYPNILEVAIVVIKSKNFGEDFKLFIKVKNKNNFNLNKLYSFCKLNLNNLYYPQEIIIVKNFEKTISGKIKKNLLLTK